MSNNIKLMNNYKGYESNPSPAIPSCCRKSGTGMPAYRYEGKNVSSVDSRPLKQGKPAKYDRQC